MNQSKFKISVEEYILSVPSGKVVSYSQVAVMCGHPGAARAVGQVAHFGLPDLPWHRLVHANGKLANGYVPGGPSRQRRLLDTEGVAFKGDKVDMQRSQVR